MNSWHRTDFLAQFCSRAGEHGIDKPSGRETRLTDKTAKRFGAAQAARKRFAVLSVRRVSRPLGLSIPCSPAREQNCARKSVRCQEFISSQWIRLLKNAARWNRSGFLL